MELTIRACEGGFYLTQLSDESESVEQKCASQGVRYKDNMKFNSLGNVREFFDALSPEQVWLVHNVAYDEMIGLASDEREHRQPLFWYQ